MAEEESIQVHSRAYLLIQRDFEILKKRDIWGIDAQQLLPDDIFEWTATIQGLSKTLWEGGHFILYMKFDEFYNNSPPKVCFHTIPFHPNIDVVTGKPCLPFLEDPSKWNPSYDVAFILRRIQNMLAEPDFENAVNQEALDLIQYSPGNYKKIAEECVKQSRKIANVADETMHSKFQKPRVLIIRESPLYKTANEAVMCRVSFEDYYNTWRGIATSKAHEKDENPLIESIRDNEKLQVVHYGQSLEDRKMQEQQREEQARLLEGKNLKQSKYQTQQQEKLEKLKQMQQRYMMPRTPNRVPAQTAHNTPSPAPPKDEVFGEDVNELLNWTDNINTENL